MEKRILIFGICLDRCLDIYEYGDSVNYKKLVKRVKNSDMNDEDKLDEVNSNGGSWYVRGCSGLMSYWSLGGYWEGDDMDEFKFNIIKYKGMDVDWSKIDEEDEEIDDDCLSEKVGRGCYSLISYYNNYGLYRYKDKFIKNIIILFSITHPPSHNYYSKSFSNYPLPLLHLKTL